MNLKTLLASAAVLAAVGAASQVQAANAYPQYPNAGTYNAATYTFTAKVTGDLTGYFAGNGASYEEEVGVLDNGVQTSGGFGLDNKTTSVGQSFDFGTVTAGDTLTFALYNKSLNLTAYSDPSLNAAYDVPGDTEHNHIYSTNYVGGNPAFTGVPAGTYVGFEDEQIGTFPNSDFDYNDEQFVFTNTKITSAAPEPSTWALMIAGVGLAGAALRFGRRNGALAAA